MKTGRFFSWLILLCCLSFLKCKDNKLYHCYYLDYDPDVSCKYILVDLDDSTFLYRPLGLGLTKIEGRIVFLKRNKIYLEPRSVSIEQIPFPDSLDESLTVFQVARWRFYESGDTLKWFPYEIKSGSDVLGKVDVETGFAVLKLDTSIHEINIGDECYPDYSAKLTSDNFQGTAWRVLLAMKPQLVEGAFYYRIKKGSLKNTKFGAVFYPCPDTAHLNFPDCLDL